jgi:alpha/beta superfamily hydrolase
VNLLPSIDPVYFRSGAKSLFGCHHAPRRNRSRSCAVLICPPVGHEYINCHRALRQLAGRLAEAGFPVLRFDYYGCGDSSGGNDEGTVHQWLEDIAAAVSELRHRTPCGAVCVIGLRLGATLGMIAGAHGADFDSLVLWDPIVDGGSYLKELVQLQREMAFFRPQPKPNRKSADALEVLGFPLPPEFHSELEKIDLLKIGKVPVRNVLVIESGQRQGCITDLKDRLGTCCIRLEHRSMDSPKIWLPTDNGSLLVPFALLQSLVSWTCEMHS